MLELIDVDRSFGPVRALDSVGFVVRPGRLTGYIGANGAGKTTSMRIVLGVLAADGGEVRWRGAHVTAADRRRFGYMPEERGLYPKMAVLDQIVFFGRLHGLTSTVARRRAGDLLGELGLAERSGDRLEKLSLGNAQRAQVAAALVHDPELLVLDEPFSGLDPIAVDAMAGMLRRRAAAGVPVLFSSHQLDLVERICDDVVLIHSGRVVAAGSAEELRAAHAPARYRLDLGEDAGWLRGVPGVAVLDIEGPHALVELAPDADDQQLLATALDRGPVRAFAPVVPTLAEIFREVAR
ncbi:MAG TPA: ATP-binding cassette domain-containing protein [Kineosporiaceae bacterium]